MRVLLRPVSILSLVAAALVPIGGPAVAAPDHSGAREGATRSWAAAEWGTFRTWERSGDGDDVIDVPRSIKAAVVSGRYEGDSNFIVWTLNKRDHEDDLLFNEIGDYRGATAFGLEDEGAARSLEIKAQGHWTLTLRPVAEAAALPSAGDGTGVYLLSRHRRMHLTHDGESNFIVTQHTGGSSGWNLLVNEIGSYSGTIRLESSASVIVVDADGHWTTRVS